MSRDREIIGVTLDTLATAIEQLEATAIGVDGLAASVKVGTLEEIVDRRVSVQRRIGETRTALVALRSSYLAG